MFCFIVLAPGHVMLWLAREAGAGGRSGAVCILVRGLSVGHLSRCI